MLLVDNIVLDMNVRPWPRDQFFGLGLKGCSRGLILLAFKVVHKFHIIWSYDS